MLRRYILWMHIVMYFRNVLCKNGMYDGRRRISVSDMVTRQAQDIANIFAMYKMGYNLVETLLA